MSIVHDQTDAQGPAYPGSQSPYPGYGFPAGPGFPPGGDGGYRPPAGPRRPHRILAGAAAAIIAFGAGAGVTAWANGAGGSGASKVLSTSKIVQMADPSVVNIVSTLGGQGAESAGTGIVLSSSGEVLTNNHVIDGATAIQVTDVGNGHTYQAKVVGYDASHDIAVLKLQGASDLQTATIGDSDTVQVGHKVVALGNAGGEGGSPKVASGQVTGLGAAITAQDEGSSSSERLTNMIRTNAPIQPGDSGGPLMNTSGQVVGIDTAASSQQESAQNGTIQAFAIPIDRAVSIAGQISSGKASGTVHIGATAFLGVEVSGQLTGSGAGVVGVVAGGAAASAGITGGDVITSVDGHAVTSPTSLRDTMTTLKAGSTVQVTWQTQSGQSQSASVVLGSGPAA